MNLAELDFLLDENIDPAVVEFLRELGFDIAQVQDLNLTGAADTTVLQAGYENRRVILTHDRDFGALAIAAGRPMFGIVHLRPGHFDANFTIGTLREIMGANIDVRPPFILVAVRNATSIRIRIRLL